ncbi:MAG: F0F1 ATP synthase subunit B' [Pseudomonadota bacterium]|nr:F0F1 ATP synthase subunit B' [Pseudomonadota bacterium]
MPQLDFATFPTQIFWLCITFLLLYLVMWKVVIPRISGVLEERQSRVENDLERAEQLQLEATSVLAAYEESISNGKLESQKIIQEATLQIAESQAHREAEALERISAMTAEAEGKINAARNDAIADIRSVAAELVQITVLKLSGSEVSREEALSTIETVDQETAL